MSVEKQILVEGLEKLDIELSDKQLSQLIEFIEILAKWNKSFNLTAVRELPKMVSYHLLDSLAILSYIEGISLLDIGTGPGLPGVPLAICRPEMSFVLLDSNGKKTRFITQAVNNLGLKNVEVVKSRIEEYQPEQGFDTVISRAFSDLDTFWAAVQHVSTPKSAILAMKGRYPVSELASEVVKPHVQWTKSIDVPGLDAERHIVCLTRE